MAGYQWYRNGSVVLRNGDKEVIGANTEWLVNDIKRGDIFIVGSQLYEIADVIGNTCLKLTNPYEGISDGSSPYAIITRAGEVLQAELALALEQAVGLFNKIDLRTKFLEGLEVSIDTDGDWSNTDTLPSTSTLASMPIATRSQLGGVKIGDNIDVTPDGTISADVNTQLIQNSLEKVAATSGDVSAMLDEVYGS